MGKVLSALTFVLATSSALAAAATPKDSVGAGAPSYTSLFSLVGDVPLGASTSRMDYESIDAGARRLYIAGMGEGKLLAFDIAQNRLVARLDGFPKVTGVLAVPDLHKVYASVPGAGMMPSLFVGLGMAGLSSGRGAVAVVDMANLKELARLLGGVFPDGIAFDPKDHRIFVSDELGSAVLVIDADTNTFLSRIDAGGEVGNVRYDPLTENIYAPVQSRNEIVAIDPKRAAIVARHALASCRHPHGLAIVRRGPAIGYVACDGNDRLLVVDLAAGRVLGTRPLAHDPDVLAVDAGANRLYVASESGGLSVFDIVDATAPAALGDVFVADGAHTVAVDPDSHRLYFALANLNGRSVVRVLAPKHP